MNTGSCYSSITVLPCLLLPDADRSDDIASRGVPLKVSGRRMLRGIHQSHVVCVVKLQLPTHAREKGGRGTKRRKGEGEKRKRG